MNRKTKGALAAAAGAVLLLGGAGSYALWSDSEDVGGDQITTGDLALDCGEGTGTWTDVSADGIRNGTAVTPATDYMVPGDTWRYDADCTVVATGKNMRAVLSVVPDSIPNAGITDPACDGPCVTTTTTMGGGNPNEAIEVVDGQSYPVTVQVAFNRETPNRVGVNTPIVVNDMTLILNQVRP